MLASLTLEFCSDVFHAIQSQQCFVRQIVATFKVGAGFQVALVVCCQIAFDYRGILMCFASSGIFIVAALAKGFNTHSVTSCIESTLVNIHVDFDDQIAWAYAVGGHDPQPISVARAECCKPKGRDAIVL